LFGVLTSQFAEPQYQDEALFRLLYESAFLFNQRDRVQRKRYQARINEIVESDRVCDGLTSYHERISKRWCGIPLNEIDASAYQLYDLLLFALRIQEQPTPRLVATY
jgi:hypothetical protein